MPIDDEKFPREEGTASIERRSFPESIPKSLIGIQLVFIVCNEPRYCSFVVNTPDQGVAIDEVLWTLAASFTIRRESENTSQIGIR